MRSKLIIIFLLMSLSGEILSSQDNVSGRFLLFKPGEKANAMGGAYTSSSGDIWSLYYNPAGIGNINSYSASGFRASPYPFDNEINHQFYAVMFPTKIGNWGISYSHFNQGSIKTNNSLEGKKRFSSYLGLTYANHYRNLQYGLNIKTLFIKRIDRDGGGSVNTKILSPITFDIGLLYNRLLSKSTIKTDWSLTFINKKWLTNPRPEGISVGLSLQNLIGKEEAIDQSQSADLPANMLLGIGYNFFNSDVISFYSVMDIENRFNSNKSVDFIRTGAECMLMRLMALRIGYIYDSNDSQLNNVTYGFGINTKYFSFDFSRNKKLFESYWAWSVELNYPIDQQ